MNRNDFTYLESKAISDSEFARLLVENLELALKYARVQLTPEVLEAIQGVDGSAFEKLTNTEKIEETGK